MLSGYLKSVTLKNCTFTDINNHWAYDAIVKAFSANVIAGYGDDTFKPDQNITREETVTMLNHLFKRNTTEEKLNSASNLNELITFSDAAKDRWSYYDIEDAANTHYVIMNGEVTGNWTLIDNKTE